MKVRPVAEWALYRWRFWIAYTLLAGLVGSLLFMYPESAPPGLSAGEQQSVLESSAIKFDQVPTQIVDIPYHALQKLSVEWLGVSPYGVRLASLVFGALTALSMVLLLGRWFKTNVAVTAGIIVLTSAWFIGMARLGMPAIMIPFWTSFLLLAATYVSQQTKHWRLWRIAFIFGSALSLYTPFMIYLFIAGILASLAQPHLRFLLRESSRVSLFIGGFFFLALLGLLGWGIYHSPNQVWQLLAIPTNFPDPLKFGQDLWLAIGGFVNPLHITIGEIITPAISLTALALLLIGGVRLLRDFHSVRSHVLLIWAALLIPLMGLNPTSYALLFVPTMLVVAIGLYQIINYWYRLFPLNPYARVFGLLPLALLMFGIVQFNYQRYFMGMLYSPQATQVFNRDPFLAQHELNRLSKELAVTVVVPKDQAAVYNLMSAGRSGTMVFTGENIPEERKGLWLVADSQMKSSEARDLGKIERTLVTDAAQNARRFWVIQR